MARETLGRVYPDVEWHPDFRSFLVERCPDGVKVVLPEGYGKCPLTVDTDGSLLDADPNCEITAWIRVIAENHGYYRRLRGSLDIPTLGTFKGYQRGPGFRIYQRKTPGVTMVFDDDSRRKHLKVSVMGKGSGSRVYVGKTMENCVFHFRKSFYELQREHRHQECQIQALQEFIDSSSLRPGKPWYDRL